MSAGRVFETSRVDFIIVLPVFSLADHKSANNTDDLTVFFALWESGRKKVADKTLVKSTPALQYELPFMHLLY
jgi:hypothetical protein